MDLQEFQAKELLSRYGLAIPEGRVAGSPQDAEKVARRMGCARYAVKAQVQAGGRGPGGGIRFAADAPAVASESAKLFGRKLVTAQTGPAGRHVRWVYIEDSVDVARELYFAVTIDRRTGTMLALASAEGAADIEVKAARNPKLIERVEIALSDKGPTADFAALAASIGLGGRTAAAAATLFAGLARAFLDLDATLIEINPLAVTPGGDLIGLDAKVVIDDNALFRHLELTKLRDFNQLEDGNPIEIEADQHHINYVAMDGSIGVVVNGAGLALATLDMLGDAGGTAANFMDIRTTASSQDIAYGFDLILANETTRCILVNIHGGGMQRCDTVAEGIGIAQRRAKRRLPLVVRMAGNNAEFAHTVLNNGGVTYTSARDMDEAVSAAVALAAREAA